MSFLRFFPACVVGGLLSAGFLTAAPQTRKISLRAVLHNPGNPLADLYIPDAAGNAVPLEFKRKDLSEALPATVTGGSILLYSSPDIDREKPTVNLVGKAKVPANLSRAILLIVPGAKGATGASKFRAMVINDSPTAFPFGSALLINGTSTEIGVLAGEHRVGAKPGEIEKIPAVDKVNDFNLAQNNFYYRANSNEEWKPFVERQLKFLKKQRRIFIVHVIPGAVYPAVATILDNLPIPPLEPR